MFISKNTVVALALAAATLATVSASTPAAAYACKSSPHQAVGVRFLQPAAKAAAIKNWQSSAKASFGLSWSLWNYASDKSNTCAKLSSGKWRCLASAKPCNYVVQ